MNIWQAIKTAFDLWRTDGVQALKLDYDAVNTRGHTEFGYTPPNLRRRANQESVYTWAPWVFAAVKRIAATAASTQFSVKKRAGDKLMDIENHPFELLLETPNPTDSQYEFFETTFGFAALTGECYWWLNRANPNDPPAEVFIIPPREIRPHPDGRLSISGYEYIPANRIEPMYLPVWQVMHVKGFNPRDRFVGLSPVEPASVTILTDKHQREWNHNNFGKHNAKVPGIIAFPDPIPDALWEKMKAEFYRDTGGTARQVMLMRNTGMNAPKWIPTHMNQQEMQYLESRQFNKEEIYDLFAPGLASMTAINATEANARTGKATFIDLVVWPLMQAIQQKITHDILPAYGPNLVGEFDDIRVTDRALKLREQEVFALTHTVNEVREKFYGDDPLTDPRGQLLPAQIAAGVLLPVQQAQPQTATQAEQERPDANPPGEDNLSVPVPEATKRAQPTEIDAEAVGEDLRRWRRKAKRNPGADFDSEHIPPWMHAAIKARLDTDPERAFDPFAQLTGVKAGDIYVELGDAIMELFRREVISKLEELMDGGDVATIAQMYPKIRELVTEYSIEAIASALIEQAVQLNMQLDYATARPFVESWARQNAGTMITQISQTDIQTVRDTVARMASNQITREEGQSILESLFGPRRAKVIADTELTTAFQRASDMLQEEAQEAGMDTEEIWYTAEDEKVCPVCGPLDQQPESIWRNTQPGGPPAHIGCRCRTRVTQKAGNNAH